MLFDDSLISKLEALAKLRFAVKDRNKIGKDLEKMVDMINALKHVDTSGVEPLVYLNEIAYPIRSDVVSQQISK